MAQLSGHAMMIIKKANLEFQEA
ncbi:hypothetical protein CCACVL1_27606 [Corchorus capsularis]|uniref:Uncharacterized protein n=1 Tax=Corchorus capsularis TaxID=210143 RepID=A0A1R3G9M5_COCAP|nr:hypothetical protein CCACVL1_27606 [Corchorus capsularis]